MKASLKLLPENRVRNAAAFEMIDIDYAGSLFLNDKKLTSVYLIVQST